MSAREAVLEELDAAVSAPSGAAVVSRAPTCSVALLGQPNSGKSTLFNALTGSRQRVGNWPGKTVEKKEGGFSRGGVDYAVCDLPGTYSLSANSEEEVVTRDYIASGRADVVCVLADASQLERSLYMLADFAGVDCACMLVLNLMDVAEAQGKRIDAKVLERRLGIPVVPFVAADRAHCDLFYQALDRLERGRQARSIAFVALTIALLGVSAWVSIPIGPVMLTLQMFAVMFAIMVLTPKQCMASIAGYLALGAIGLPMFSGMRGGIGMLMGPTGGYLWGFLLAAAVALLVREGLRRAIGEKGVSGPMAIVVDMVACLAFIIVTYVCGCFQYAAVVGVDLAAAFMVTIAPFAVPDLLKAVAAVLCARAVLRALPKR